MRNSTKIGVYGWGIVAPGARSVAELRAANESGTTMLTPAEDLALGRGLFLVGQPSFDFDDYREWMEARGGPARFAQLREKLSDNALFAIGSVIQAVESNPGLERALREADRDVHVYLGSGVGDLPANAEGEREFRVATIAWNRFWGSPPRCHALRRYLEDASASHIPGVPQNPTELEVDSDERYAARLAWDAFWAARSEDLREFEARYAAIETAPHEQPRANPAEVIKTRQRLHRRLIAETGCPTPPWTSVDPRMLWAIQNVPAAQTSMLLGLHGAAFAPVGACSTFAVALKLGFDAITRGEAKVAVIGTTDPRPHPALISAFHRGRLVAGAGEVNAPLTQLRGTHIAGGACVWIIGDVEYMRSKGIAPIGPTIRAVAISSDAEHIITPSVSGPKNAIRDALTRAGVTPDDLGVWDMHATGTPGDLGELELLREFLGTQTVITARKEVFGHGMANAGGWELTALALDLAARRASPTGRDRDRLHPAIDPAIAERIVTSARAIERPYAAKLMLGIGGISACVVLESERA